MDLFISNVFQGKLEDIGHGAICLSCALNISKNHKETLGRHCPGCRNSHNIKLLSLKQENDKFSCKIEDYPINNIEIENEILCQELNQKQTLRREQGYYSRFYY